VRIGSSAVDVVSDRIIVRPSFADILCCRAIPGGAWDRSRKAYSFPATAASAKLLRNSLKAFRATPAFDALLTTAPASDAAPVAPERRPPIQEQDPPLALPDGLRTKPWRHQIAALRFCFEKFATGLRGILLAMGMGTGKSLVALIVLLHLRARRVFIASPLRVVPVWLTQFERHVSAEFVVVALDEEAGSVAKKAELANQKMKLAETRGVPFVCIVNYDSAWREPFATWAEKQRWDVVILDEAHRIKAPGGKASLFFKRLRKVAAYRIALTGTPMPHGPMDIYAIFRFLDITIFGPSFSSFRAKYAVMGGYQRKQITGFQHLEELEALMARNTFRIGKEVLDLPPATHVTYYCELGPEARRVYKDLDDDFVAEYLNGLITAANALVKLTRLQQVANGVVKTENGIEHRIDDSKKKLLSDTLEDIGGDEPVVVFCRYHLDLDAVHEACKAVGLESLELSGRRDELARWQDGEGQVLAVQISAGGIGVDLTRARFSIYYSLSFSLGDYDQSLSRIHRPGQTRPVEHIHLVARNTVDVKIMRALEKRAEIIESILAEINSQQAEDLK
jgi:SNF2 family DNA or RNA helicase